MAKPRSPNYPVIGLPDAIKKARKIWDKERHGKMSREVAVKHMGYNTLNGASMGVVSALGKYGLLEGRGDELRLSPVAMSILHDPADSAERKAAIRAAALAPALFQEFHNDFGDHVPSEENLRAYLLKRGFIPGAAAAANRAYRETMAIVEEEAGDYTSGAESPPEENHAMSTPVSPSPPRAPQPVVASMPAVGNTPSVGQGVLLLQVPFKGTTLTVRVDAGGLMLTKEHVARVRKYLELAELDLGGEGQVEG
jgi:hypothetical protein